MKILNIACGSRISPNITHQWENIDFSPLDKRVKKVNLLKRLPYNDNTFDVAYSSHFLEHLSKENAIVFLHEVWRVMKVGGILRVVVPDLENVVKEYLSTIVALRERERERDGAHALWERYDWVLVELFDQMIRIKSGGEMGKYLQNLPHFSAEFRDYIISRTQSLPVSASQVRLRDKITLDKITNKFLNLYLRFIKILIPKSLRDEIFIQTSIGERHKWAYDELSLKRLLQNCGFVECERFNFNASQIPCFESFCLDNNKDGSAYKGASLYIECRK